MRALNPDHLSALIEVIEQQSFTRAAERLNMAQPTISLQIKELEARLGVQLVERLGKKAYPTPAGRVLITHAHLIKQETDRALTAMRRYREGWLGQVRLGASATALIYHIPPVLRRVRSKHPQIELVVTTGTTATVVQGIHSNAIDLGVVSLPVGDSSLEVVPLLSEPLVAIFPRTTKGLPKRVTPAHLAQHPLILEYARAQVKAMLTEWLSRDAMVPHAVMELDNLEAVKRMVAAGLGASIIPQAAVAALEDAQDLICRPLDPPLSRTLALIQRRNKTDSALKVVRDALLELGKP